MSAQTKCAICDGTRCSRCGQPLDENFTHVVHHQDVCSKCPIPESLFSKAIYPEDRQKKPLRRAHSKSEYKRLSAQGANVLPPLFDGEKK
jgi:recombinational DNA repair protein (RecF pathway)